MSETVLTKAASEAATDMERLATARGLVPSTREVTSGVVPPYEFQPEAEAPDAPRMTVMDGLRTFGRQLNVREIASGGPVLPLILLGYLSLVYQLDGQAVNLLLPEIKDGFGTSAGLMTIVIAMLALARSALSPLMGFISDRARRTLMLSVGTVISHGSIALGGVAPSLPLFFGARALGTAGDLVREPVGFSLMTDYYPPHTRARVFAFVGIGTALGGVIGPIIAGLVGSSLGWRPTLLVFGGVATVASLSFFLLREPVRGAQDRRAMGADEEAVLREQRPVSWSEGWRAAWSVRTLRHIAFAFPFITAAGASLLVLQPLFYAERFHLDPLGRGLIVSLVTVPGIIGLGLSGPATDRILAYRPGRVLGLVAGVVALQAIGLLVFIYSPNLPIAILFNMIPAFFGAVILPALQTVISLVVPSRIRGLGLQVIAPFAALGIPIPLLLIRFEGTNGIQAAMTILVPVLLVGAAILATAGSGAELDIRAALAASLADEAARKARSEGRTKMLVCRDLGVTYDGAQVLHGVDLDVEEGELLALLGTNGAGKSTVLRAIAGVQQASGGAIFLDGDDITHVPPQDIAARGVVMMPGGQAVFPTLTVEQNLKTAGWLYRNDPGHEKAKIGEVLDRFPRLRERWSALAGNLSGGEQQMVALGQALLMKPRLLMIDELSLGLAPQVVEMLLETLREINRQGTTIIIVEQSINVALQVARRAVYMEKGEVRFDGPVAELISRPDVVRSVFLSGAATSASLGGGAGRGVSPYEIEREQVLELSDVRLSYGGLQVLNGVSLAVGRGEVVGIIGPNGAGKTSLFDVVTGFARPEAGTIALLGRDVTRMAPDARARMGLARSYQNVRLFPALTVRENVAVALERHLQSRNAVLAAVWSPMTRKSERRVKRRVDNLVESLGLGAYADKFLNELSTGTRRIVDIACLLASQPQMLLLDEPSSGLAQAETEQLGPVISRIVKEAGCGILVIEHDLGLVASVSDRLVAMRLGAVMADGPPATVMANQEVIDAILGGASDAVLSRTIGLAGAGVTSG